MRNSGVVVALAVLALASCVGGTDQQFLTAGDNPGQVARLMSYVSSDALSSGQLCDAGSDAGCSVDGELLSSIIPSQCSGTLISSGTSKPRFGLVTAAHCLVGHDELLDRYPRAGKAYEHPDIVGTGTIWLPECDGCRGKPSTAEGAFEQPIWAETFVETREGAERVVFVPNAVRFIEGRDIALLTRVPRGKDTSRGFFAWNGRRWAEGYETMVDHGKKVGLEPMVDRAASALSYDADRYVYWCGFGNSGNVTASYDDPNVGSAPCSGWLKPSQFRFNSASGNAFVANRQQWADSGSSGGGVLVVDEPDTAPSKDSTARLGGVLIERFDSCGSGEIGFDDCQALPHCAPTPQALPVNTQLARNLELNSPAAFAQYLADREPDAQVIRDQLDELLYFGTFATDGAIDDPATADSGAQVAAFALLNFYEGCTSCTWPAAIDDLMLEAALNDAPDATDAGELLSQTRAALESLRNEERDRLAVAYLEFSGGFWTCAPKPDYVASAEIINGIAPFSPADVEQLEKGIGVDEDGISPTSSVFAKAAASFSVLLCVETDIGGIRGAVCSAPGGEGLTDPISPACKNEIEELLTVHGVRGDIRLPFMISAELGHSLASPYQQHFGLGRADDDACNTVLVPEDWNATMTRLPLADFVTMVTDGRAYAPDGNQTSHDLADESARRIEFDQVGRLTVAGRAVEQCVGEGAQAVGFGVGTCGLVSSRHIYGDLKPEKEGDEPLGSMIGKKGYLEGRACELAEAADSSGAPGDATGFLHPITKEPAVSRSGQSLCFDRANNPVLEVQWVAPSMAKVLWHAMRQMETSPDESAALRVLRAAYRLNEPLDQTLGQLGKACSRLKGERLGGCIRASVKTFAELAAGEDWFGAALFQDWPNVGSDLRYQSDDGLAALQEQWQDKAKYYPLPSEFQRGTPDPLESFLEPEKQNDPAAWFKVGFLAKTFTGNEAASVMTNHAKMGTMNLWAAALLVDALNHGGESLKTELAATMLGRYLDALYVHSGKRFAILAFGAGNMTFLAPDPQTILQHAEAAVDMWGGAPAGKLPFEGNPWTSISPVEPDGQYVRGRLSGHQFQLDFDNSELSTAQVWAGTVSKSLIAESIFTSGFGSAIWGSGTGSGIDFTADFGGDVWGTYLGSGIWASAAGSGIWGTLVGDGIWGDAIGSGIWAGNLGDGIWGDMLGGGIWGVGTGSGIWGSFSAAGIWGSDLGTGVWGNHSGTGIWASLAGSGIWGNPLGSGVWGAPAGSGVWGDSLGDGIWATGLGSGIWGNTAGSGIWANHLGGGIWGSSSGSGIWSSQLGYGIWGSSLGSGIWGSGLGGGIWGGSAGGGIWGTFLGGGIWGGGLGNGIWGAAGGTGIWGAAPGSGIWASSLGGGIHHGGNRLRNDAL